jgi:predicted Zn-dependent protease
MNTSQQVHFPLAIAALQDGRSLAELAGLSKDLIRVLYASAVGLYESAQYEQALEQLHALTVVDTRNPDLWALMGNCMLRLGRFPDAVTSWRIALAASPSFATAATLVKTAVAIRDAEAAAEALMVARMKRTTPNQFADYEVLVDLWNRQFLPAS